MTRPNRCRRLAGAIYNRETASVLETMAVQFDRTADDLRNQANG